MYTFIHLFTNTATPQKEDYELVWSKKKTQNINKK